MMNLLPRAMGAVKYASQWPKETTEAEMEVDKVFEWKGRTVFIDPSEELAAVSSFLSRKRWVVCVCSSVVLLCMTWYGVLRL